MLVSTPFYSLQRCTEHYIAPSAIFIAVIGTGLLGWLLNIVMILCSGDMFVLPISLLFMLIETFIRANLPGPSGSAFLQIMYLRMGKTGALILWVRPCWKFDYESCSNLYLGFCVLHRFFRCPNGFAGGFAYHLRFQP
jgi:hypothetical protein